MTTLTTDKIKEISDQLDCGFRCFLHRQNNKLLFIPDTTRHIEIDTEAWATEIDELENNFDNYFEIDQLESGDTFRIMQQFTDTLKDTNQLKEKLIDALQNKKPFRQFKFIIDNSRAYRQNWFDFKSRKIQEWVVSKLDSFG